MIGWDDGWGVGDWLAMGLMMAMMVAFWGVLIALVVGLVRGADTRHHAPGGFPGDSSERADEVLAERFARGEIDEDEFTRRRDLLHQR